MTLCISHLNIFIYGQCNSKNSSQSFDQNNRKFMKDQQFRNFSFPNHLLDQSWLELSGNQQNQNLCLPTNQNQITYNHREIAHNCYRRCGLEILTPQLPYSIDILRMRKCACKMHLHHHDQLLSVGLWSLVVVHCRYRIVASSNVFYYLGNQFLSKGHST